jgi:hypothetical protein
VGKLWFRKWWKKRYVRCFLYLVEANEIGKKEVIHKNCVVLVRE